MLSITYKVNRLNYRKNVKNVCGINSVVLTGREQVIQPVRYGLSVIHSGAMNSERQTICLKTAFNITGLFTMKIHFHRFFADRNSVNKGITFYKFLPQVMRNTLSRWHQLNIKQRSRYFNRILFEKPWPILLPAIHRFLINAYKPAGIASVRSYCSVPVQYDASPYNR